MKRNSFLKRARIVVYVLVLVVVGYHVLRYDLLRLPDGYCSPIARFSPGDRLLVDRWTEAYQVDDPVLFRSLDDKMLLGVVRELPPSAPDEMHLSVAEGALWIVTTAADCPGTDSRRLGPIHPDDMVGRIAMRLPF